MFKLLLVAFDQKKYELCAKNQIFPFFFLLRNPCNMVDHIEKCLTLGKCIYHISCCDGFIGTLRTL